MQVVETISNLIFEQKKTVTYKLLAVVLGISTPQAKDVLNQFVENRQSDLAVTYLLSGFSGESTKFSLSLVTGDKLKDVATENTKKEVYAVTAKKAESSHLSGRKEALDLHKDTAACYTDILANKQSSAYFSMIENKRGAIKTPGQGGTCPRQQMSYGAFNKQGHEKKPAPKPSAAPKPKPAPAATPAATPAAPSTPKASPFFASSAATKQATPKATKQGGIMGSMFGAKKAAPKPAAVTPIPVAAESTPTPVAAPKEQTSTQTPNEPQGDAQSKAALKTEDASESACPVKADEDVKKEAAPTPPAEGVKVEAQEEKKEPFRLPKPSAKKPKAPAKKATPAKRKAKEDDPTKQLKKKAVKREGPVSDSADLLDEEESGSDSDGDAGKDAERYEAEQRQAETEAQEREQIQRDLMAKEAAEQMKRKRQEAESVDAEDADEDPNTKKKVARTSKPKCPPASQSILHFSKTDTQTVARKKKLVTKTVMNDDGEFVQQDEWVDDDSAPVEDTSGEASQPSQKEEAAVKQTQPAKSPLKPITENQKAKPAATKKAPGKTASISSFFKKK